MAAAPRLLESLNWSLLDQGSAQRDRPSGLPHSKELQPQQSRDLRFAPAQEQAKEIGLQLRMPPRSLSPDRRQRAGYL